MISPLDAVGSAWSTAWTYRVRTGLTILGIVIGVASVIFLVALGDGLKLYITREFNSFGTQILIIKPGRSETTGRTPALGTSSRHPLLFEDAIAIQRRCPGIAAVAPVVVGEGSARYGNRTRNAFVLGVNHHFQEVRQFFVEIGSFIPTRDQNTDQRVCVLGSLVSRELFGDENPLGQLVHISGSPMRVIGIMESRGWSLGFNLDDVVFVPVRTAQKLFDTRGLFEILVSVSWVSGWEEVERQIRSVLLQRHDRVEDFTFYRQADMLDSLQSILDTMTIALGCIAGISLVVGGIGIMNIMLVSVGERTREIGLRMAVGARRKDIRLQFLVESITFGILGGGFGILLGIGLTQAVPLIWPKIPVVIAPGVIVLSFGVSFLVGLFFGIYPAERAARMNPILALRYE
jgi:putative ABC transport system permease protein